MTQSLSHLWRFSTVTEFVLGVDSISAPMKELQSRVNELGTPYAVQTPRVSFQFLKTVFDVITSSTHRTYPGPTATPSQRPLFSIFGTSTIIMATDDYNTRLEAVLAELALQILKSVCKFLEIVGHSLFHHVTLLIPQSP